MLRKLNFTERAKVSRADFQITLRRDAGGTLAFDPVLRLDTGGLPADARVFIEAYNRTASMRFDCGRVGAIQIPADRRLTSIGSGSIRFRLKVVAPEDKRILAVADDLRVSEQKPERNAPTPLLPVEFSSQLGQLPWRITYEPDSAILELNNQIPDIEKRAREDPSFFALVYPAAVREILTQILLVEGHDPLEGGDDWWNLWIRWAAAQTASPRPAHRDDMGRWIDDVVGGFCDIQQCGTRLRPEPVE